MLQQKNTYRKMIDNDLSVVNLNGILRYLRYEGI